MRLVTYLKIFSQQSYIYTIIKEKNISYVYLLISVRVYNICHQWNLYLLSYYFS